MTEIVIEGTPQWPTVVVGLIAGLGGAIVGVIAMFLLEAWKQVVLGRGALRAMRMELKNAELSLQTLTQAKLAMELPSLSTEAWSASQQTLALLLDDESFESIARAYGMLFVLRDAALPMWSKASLEDQGARMGILENGLKNLQEVIELVESIDFTRTSLLLSVLRGRPVTPTKATATDGKTTSVKQPPSGARGQAK